MVSPMMQQFEAAKARCPGALVLFRMGDFYELFGADAREAADLLDLTLTSRDKGPDALPVVAAVADAARAADDREEERDRADDHAVDYGAAAREAADDGHGGGDG